MPLFTRIRLEDGRAEFARRAGDAFHVLHGTPWADPAETEVIVRSEVAQPRGEPIQLDYRMEKASDGWKIYDVNVLGVWLVETYRGQFAQEVGARGIDGLIKSLVDKNRSFESPRKS